MHALEAERLDQPDQIVRVQRQRVLLPVGLRRIGPVIAPAVGDHPEPGRERVDLRRPAFERAEAAVHEHDRDAGAALHEPQVGPADAHDVEHESSRRGRRRGGRRGRLA